MQVVCNFNKRTFIFFNDYKRPLLAITVQCENGKMFCYKNIGYATRKS